jgi:hypothetical protein
MGKRTVPPVTLTIFMSNRTLSILAVVALVAGAFGGGVLIQRHIQLSRIRAGEAFARDLAGLNDPVSPSPPWSEWHYPKAKVKGTAESAAVRVSGKLVRPGGHYAVLVTADDFETVARFYAGKLKFADSEGIVKSQLAFSSEGNIQGESSHVLDDYRDVGETQKARPVRTKCLVRRSPSYDLTVFLTRAETETETHILLLYDPSTEAEQPK